MLSRRVQSVALMLDQRRALLTTMLRRRPCRWEAPVRMGRAGPGAGLPGQARRLLPGPGLEPRRARSVALMLDQRRALLTTMLRRRPCRWEAPVRMGRAAPESSLPGQARRLLPGPGLEPRRAQSVALMLDQRRALPTTMLRRRPCRWEAPVRMGRAAPESSLPGQARRLLPGPGLEPRRAQSVALMLDQRRALLTTMLRRRPCRWEAPVRMGRAAPESSLPGQARRLLPGPGLEPRRAQSVALMLDQRRALPTTMLRRRPCRWEAPVRMGRAAPESSLPGQARRLLPGPGLEPRRARSVALMLDQGRALLRTMLRRRPCRWEAPVRMGRAAPESSLPGQARRLLPGPGLEPTI